MDHLDRRGCAGKLVICSSKGPPDGDQYRWSNTFATREHAPTYRLVQTLWLYPSFWNKGVERFVHVAADICDKFFDCGHCGKLSSISCQLSKAAFLRING